MDDRQALAVAVAAFESAARALEAARQVLVALVAPEPAGGSSEPSGGTSGGCRHVDAVEITSLGGGAPVYLCPDCQEQFS
jgi:hypothetical protein